MTENYHISSSALANRFQVEVLKALSFSFKAMGKDFIVIGAASRDILRNYMNAEASTRRTKDLDIAIGVDTWDDFFLISKTLQSKGFRKDPAMKQRFYFQIEDTAEYEIDIVPFGGVAKDDQNIYWPPEENPRMSVKGFSSVLKDCIEVIIDDEFSFKIPSVPAFFILKLDAWGDRHLLNNKDAKDMSYIMNNYYLYDVMKGLHLEICDILADNFDEYVAGAYLLANDITALLNQEELASYLKGITSELALAENSALLNDCMIEGVTFDEVKEGWSMIATVFREAIGK